MLHRIWIPAPLLVFAVVVSIAEAETFGAVARGTERGVGEHVAVGAVSCACPPMYSLATLVCLEIAMSVELESSRMLVRSSS